VQVKFVTRSGTNSFAGSGYEYYRRDKLNANTWFNNRDGVAKAKLKQDQMGVRVGGPVVFPGWYDGHNKAFFFVNYEEVHQPSDTTRNRVILNPDAQNGQLHVGGGSVNVLQLPRPTVSSAPSIRRSPRPERHPRRDAEDRFGRRYRRNLQRYTFNVPVESVQRYPTVRMDYNFTQNHRLSGSYNWQQFHSYPTR
jgi:hypothetical protein